MSHAGNLKSKSAKISTLSFPYESKPLLMSSQQTGIRLQSRESDANTLFRAFYSGASSDSNGGETAPVDISDHHDDENEASSLFESQASKRKKK